MTPYHIAELVVTGICCAGVAWSAGRRLSAQRWRAYFVKRQQELIDAHASACKENRDLHFELAIAQRQLKGLRRHLAKPGSVWVRCQTRLAWVVQSVEEDTVRVSLIGAPAPEVELHPLEEFFSHFRPG